MSTFQGALFTILYVRSLQSTGLPEIPNTYNYNPDHYYTSTLTLNFFEAELYCKQICNSHLISIHTWYDHLVIRNKLTYPFLLNNEDGNITPNITFLIGLSNTTESNEFAWSDSTNFDYGSNFTALPWYHDLTNPIVDDFSGANCVEYRYLSESKVFWFRTNCSKSTYFVCDSCMTSEIIEEESQNLAYYIPPNTFTFPDAWHYCNSQCDSNIISLHSEQQYSFAKQVARFNADRMGRDNIWIGLWDQYQIGILRWITNKGFNFGNNMDGTYPWKAEEPKLLQVWYSH